MSFTAGSLFDGQVADSQGTIYTVPTGSKVYVRGLSLFNTNVAQQTITLWLKRAGGTARKWRQVVLDQNEYASILESEGALALSSGDEIQAQTTTAAAVDYFGYGVLET